MTGNDTALDGTRTHTLREKAGAGVVLHYRLDPTEHARRRQAGAAPLTRVDHLDTLLTLPGGIKVRLEALTRSERQRIRALPAGAVRRTATAVTRLAVRPLAVELAVVIGSNPAFDQAFLTRWLARYGQVWAAHYRTVDVTTLGHGYLAGRELGYDAAENTPPNTHKVARAFGIEPDTYDRHTALGDARMVRDLYHAITEGQ